MDRSEEAYARGLYPRPLNEGRSRNMRANKRTGTRPEVTLRSALHRLGYRYRKDFLLRLPDGLRVRPDVVFTARKVAVFVDGCFWHACPVHGRNPATNEWYWTPKLARNADRDRRVNESLSTHGWTVVRVWEHETLNDAISAITSVAGSARRETISSTQRPASGATGGR